ncbi:hypothetical protein SSX86_008511 [Deinandra increscens subsp. villosa]|uniref:F-box domain-containing protein n=1 Tax=Deinandra increscens subsp. villosa TaxID=3103831 RepID=A0AAP0DBU2_9ASTR
METLKEQRSTMTVDRFPTEIINEIISRLPVKSILRFRSVSKPWLSRISDPSLIKLQLTHATASHRAALFLSAYDKRTRKRFFLSAAPDGGPATLLMTIDDSRDTDITTEHLNGFVCLACEKSLYDYNDNIHAFVVNPSTRQMFTIPDPTDCSGYGHLGYFFGFDESRNEHKILLIRYVLRSSKVEFMIYSLSNHSWRKIDVERPVGFSWGRLSCHLDGGVCVNSVVHIMLLDLSYDILALDLKTEKLSIISIPQDVLSREPSRTSCCRSCEIFLKDNKLYIMKINGCLGVVCHDRVAESSEIDIWILQDYDNRVWVRETVKFPESWSESGGPFPLPVDVNMDEIIFSASKVSGNVIRLPVYNMKTRCFKSLHFTLGDQFLCSETVKFNHTKCYVESIMPL